MLKVGLGSGSGTPQLAGRIGVAGVSKELDSATIWIESRSLASRSVSQLAVEQTAELTAAAIKTWLHSQGPLTQVA